MAKTPAGILGHFSGKVGAVVGASWKGIRYIREYVVPANPNTASQVIQRTAFGDLVSLAKALLGPILQVFWDPFLSSNSGWAHFIGLNRKLYVTPDDYSTVHVAEGQLEGAVVSAAVYAAGNVSIQWDETVLGNGALTDKACCFVYDEEHKVGFFRAVETRDAESASVAVGTGRDNTKLNAWLFFADSSTAPTKVSYSDHADVTVP